MTTGTKILLAVIGLFTGCLIIYYGFFLGAEGDDPPVERDSAMVGAELGGADALQVEQPTITPPPADPPKRQGRNEGLLGDAVSRARGNGNPPASSPPLGRDESTVGDVEPVTPQSNPPRSSANGSNRFIPPPARQLPPTSSQPPAGSDGGKDADIPAVTQPRTLPKAPEGGTPSSANANPPKANQPATLVPPKTTQAAPPARTTPPPARTTPQRTGPVQYSSYTVREGDTLSGIALDWFNDSSKWDLIAAANPEVDPTRLAIGKKLRMPPKSATRRSVQNPPAGPSTNRATYTVRSEDTLSSISTKVYGQAKYWRTIFNANRAAIGSDPDRLTVGMRLVIPKR